MKKQMMIPALALGLLFATQVNAQVVPTEKEEVQTEVPAQKEYEKIETSQLPDAVKKAVATDYAGTKITEAYKAKDNTYKIVLMTKTGEKGTVFADEKGNWITPPPTM